MTKNGTVCVLIAKHKRMRQTNIYASQTGDEKNLPVFERGKL